jgi:hypothetical protein
MEVMNWKKSSYSGSNSQNCVEAASLRSAVAVRDSKNPDGPKLVISPADWRSFTASVKAGRFELA